MQITVTKALCLTVVFHGVSFSGYLLALFVNCSEAPWSGTVADNGLTIILFSRGQTIDKVGQLLWTWFSFQRQSADEIVEP